MASYVNDGVMRVKDYGELLKDKQFDPEYVRSVLSGKGDSLFDRGSNPLSPVGLAKEYLVPDGVQRSISNRWQEAIKTNKLAKGINDAKNVVDGKLNKITDSAIRTDFNLGQKIIDKADKINVASPIVSPQGTSVGKRVSNSIHNLTNSVKSDIKEGAKSTFTDQVPLVSKTPGATAAHFQTVNVSHPSLTAPVSKAKKTIVPIATSLALMYGANKLNKHLDERAAQKKLDKQQRSLDKVASFVEREEHLRRSNENLRKIAMTSISYSDGMISKQKAQIEKLATENCMLKLDAMAEIRYKVASDLSDNMIDSGLITPSEYSKTLEQIMSMDDDSYEKFASVVRNVQKKQNKSQEDLTSDVFNFNIKEESSGTSATSPNMEDAIINL